MTKEISQITPEEQSTFQNFETVRKGALALFAEIVVREPSISSFKYVLEIGQSVLGVTDLDVGRACGKYSKTVHAWKYGGVAATPDDMRRVLTFLAAKAGTQFPFYMMELLSAPGR